VGLIMALGTLGLIIVLTDFLTSDNRDQKAPVWVILSMAGLMILAMLASPLIANWLIGTGVIR